MHPLTYLRHQKGFGQIALARRAAVSQTVISLIETGRLNPRPEELQKLADALGVTPSVLLGRVTLDTSPTEDRAFTRGGARA